MLANCSHTSIDSLPAGTSQTVRSRCYEYNISKLIWHLCKIWQSYPINCSGRDVAVTDMSSSASSAPSSSPRLAMGLCQWYPQCCLPVVTSPIAHCRSLQRDQMPPLEPQKVQSAYKTPAENVKFLGESQEQSCKHHRRAVRHAAMGGQMHTREQLHPPLGI